MPRTRGGRREDKEKEGEREGRKRKGRKEGEGREGTGEGGREESGNKDNGTEKEGRWTSVCIVTMAAAPEMAVADAHKAAHAAPSAGVVVVTRTRSFDPVYRRNIRTHKNVCGNIRTTHTWSGKHVALIHFLLC